MGSDSGVGTDGTTTSVVLSTTEVRDGYASANGQNITAADAVRILDAILSRDASEDLTISEIRTSITLLSNAVSDNTKEIVRLDNLIGSLIFELTEQGFEFGSKNILFELEKFCKK